MNLPNKLTIIRIVLTPFYLLAMLVEFPYHYIVASVIFVIAALTDFFDGEIARRKNIVTTFGKLCDPVADKMLTTAAMLAFMQLGLCNIWIVMVVLTREFLITSFRLVATAQGIVIPAGILGKIKTATQMIFSIGLMIAVPLVPAEHFNGIFAIVSNVLMGITALLAVISGIKYIVDGIKVIDFSE